MRLSLGKNTHVYVTLIGMALIFFAQPYKLLRLVSLGTTVIILATLLAIVVSFFLKGMRKLTNDTWNEDLLVILLVLSAGSAFVFGGQYSYSQIVPVICLLELPILMNSVTNSTRKIRNVVFWLFYLFSVYCIILSGSSFAHQYVGRYGVTDIEALTLGLPNPNQTAIYLTMVFFVLCVAIVEQRKKITKTLFAINAVVVAYLLYCTESRTAWVVTILFAFYIFPKVRKKFSRVLMRFAPMVPMLFAVVLITYKDVLTSIMFMGDAFETGRVDIFARAFESMDISNLIFGNYKEYASHNLHNIFISVLVEYGIIATGLFWGFMWRIGNKRVDNNSGSAMLAAVGVALVMVFSSTEAALYIGGSLYAGFVFVLHYLSLPLEPNEV